MVITNNHEFDDKPVDLSKEFIKCPLRVIPNFCKHKWIGIPTTEEAWCEICGIDNSEFSNLDKSV